MMRVAVVAVSIAGVAANAAEPLRPFARTSALDHRKPVRVNKAMENAQPLGQGGVPLPVILGGAAIVGGVVYVVADDKKGTSAD